MKIVQILKLGLFIYECFRIVIMALTLVYLVPEANPIPWLAFCAPSALFPLMALFLWIDISRYKVYLPLFIAGKCISIFSLLGWSILFRDLTMLTGFYGIYIITELVFLCGDVMALAAVLLILRSMQKQDKQKMTDIYDKSESLRATGSTLEQTDTEVK